MVYIEGYFDDEITGKEIERIVQEIQVSSLSQPSESSYCFSCVINLEPINTTKSPKLLTLPILGKVNVPKANLLILTTAIAFVDSLNPCSIYVLVFLLSFLLYAQSRRRVLLIGLVFVITTGIVYYLILLAWLNVFTYIGYVNLLRVVIGLFSVVIGVINLKDFFYFGKGISLRIPDEFKLKLTQKIKRISRTKVVSISLIISVILLAFFVNLIDLFCTIGFPLIYAKILTMHNLSALSYNLYITLYVLIYITPLILIVTIFTVTSKIIKITEKRGRVLKLISGLVLVILGLIIIVAPHILT